MENNSIKIYLQNSDYKNDESRCLYFRITSCNHESTNLPKSVYIPHLLGFTNFEKRKERFLKKAAHNFLKLDLEFEKSTRPVKIDNVDIVETEELVNNMKSDFDKLFNILDNKNGTNYHYYCYFNNNPDNDIILCLNHGEFIRQICPQYIKSEKNRFVLLFLDKIVTSSKSNIDNAMDNATSLPCVIKSEPVTAGHNERFASMDVVESKVDESLDDNYMINNHAVSSSSSSSQPSIDTTRHQSVSLFRENDVSVSVNSGSGTTAAASSSLRTVDSVNVSVQQDLVVKTENIININNSYASSRSSNNNDNNRHTNNNNSNVAESTDGHVGSDNIVTAMRMRSGMSRRGQKRMEKKRKKELLRNNDHNQHNNNNNSDIATSAITKSNSNITTTAAADVDTNKPCIFYHSTRNIDHGSGIISHNTSKCRYLHDRPPVGSHAWYILRQQVNKDATQFNQEVKNNNENQSVSVESWEQRKLVPCAYLGLSSYHSQSTHSKPVINYCFHHFTTRGCSQDLACEKCHVLPLQRSTKHWGAFCAFIRSKLTADTENPNLTLRHDLISSVLSSSRNSSNKSGYNSRNDKTNSSSKNNNNNSGISNNTINNSGISSYNNTGTNNNINMAGGSNKAQVVLNKNNNLNQHSCNDISHSMSIADNTHHNATARTTQQHASHSTAADDSIIVTNTSMNSTAPNATVTVNTNDTMTRKRKSSSILPSMQITPPTTLIIDNPNSTASAATTTTTDLIIPGPSFYPSSYPPVSSSVITAAFRSHSHIRDHPLYNNHRSSNNNNNNNNSSSSISSRIVTTTTTTASNHYNNNNINNNNIIIHSYHHITPPAAESYAIGNVLMTDSASTSPPTLMTLYSASAMSSSVPAAQGHKSGTQVVEDNFQDCHSSNTVTAPSRCNRSDDDNDIWCLTETECLVEQWRQSIYNALLIRSELSLHELETRYAARPSGLAKIFKIKNVVQTDPNKRFRIHVRSNFDTVVLNF